MSAAKTFIDTNVLLYLLSADAAKADQAEAIVDRGGLISVQVLNELANAIRRKLALSWVEIKDLLVLIRALCQVVPVTVETHEKGLEIAERYGLSIYDAMIVSAAILAGCETIYSEDMQAGLVIDKRVRILNPFSDQ